MDQFDEMLKERAKREPFPLPEDYGGRVFATCVALEDPRTKKHKRPAARWTAWAAAALALVIVIPNLSPAAAAAMADIPGVLQDVQLILRHKPYWIDRLFAKHHRKNRIAGQYPSQ